MRLEQKGIVLKSKDQGESSRLVTILTEKENIQEFIIHGFKSKKSDNKAIFQTANLLIIATEIKKNKKILVNSELLSYFPCLKNDLKKVSFVADCYKKLLNLPFDLKYDLQKLFILVEKMQIVLEEHQISDFDLLELYFNYSLTYCFGVRPEESNVKKTMIAACDALYFNPENGTVSIDKLSDYSKQLSKAAADLLINLYQFKLIDIIKQKADKTALDKVAELLKSYFKIHLNFTLM